MKQDHPPECKWHKDWHACDCGLFDKQNEEMTDDEETILHDRPHKEVGRGRAARVHRVPTADEMVTAQQMTAPTRLEIEWRNIQKDGYVSTEGGRAAVEAVADQIRESEDSRILGMLQSLGFADSEPPTPFASMKDIAKRRFTGEE